MKVSKIFSLIFALTLCANQAFSDDSQAFNKITVSEEVHHQNSDILKDYVIKFHAYGGAYVVLNTENKELIDKQFAGSVDESFAVWSRSALRLFHYAIALHKDDINDEEKIDLYAESSELFDRVAKADRDAYYRPYLHKTGYAMPTILLLAYMKVFENKDNYLSEKQLERLKDAVSENVKSGKAKKANVEGLNVSGLTSTTYKDKDGEKVYTVFIGEFEVGEQNYAIITLLDEPEALKSTYGFKTSGWNATPMAGEIIKNIANKKSGEE